MTHAAMLCLLALAATLLQAREAEAQWVTSGTNINNTNTGNVGVGTTAPDTKLNIVGSNLSASFPVMASFYDTALPAIDTGAGVLLGGAYNTNGGFAGFGAIKGLKANAANGDLTGGVGFYTRGGPGNMSERMRIDSSGNIGIGTASPAAKLHVGAGNILLDNTYYLAAKDPSGTVRDVLYGRWSNDTTILRGGTGGLIFDVNNMPTNSLVIDGNGHLGVNHYTHNQVQQWLGTSGANVFGQIISLSAGQTLPAIEVRNSSDAAIANINASGGAYFAGKIGIGTAAPATALHVVGDVTVTGNINAKYQDVAEWVPTTERLAAGTVVIVDAKGANRVLASAAAYDTSVAGVVSAQPGLTLGEAGEGKALVATTGRVKVKVDATRAPIRAGDLLVTSDVAGVAMKSEPVLFGGVAMHRPGTIIGKALESLDKGTGEILVLLSLQ